MTQSYEMVIGIEVHAQLLCQSKIFSPAPTAFGALPNNQVDLLDMAMPGTLPVLNRQACHLAIRFGLVTGSHIHSQSVFARKNYFYPDLPKGYQISQYEHPIVGKGQLTIELPDQAEKVIRITRAHLEEDAGKSVHDGFYGDSGIDLNRAGTPLLEIVSEPDIRSADEAVAYLKKLHHLLRYYRISDANMQEGSFRADINISHRLAGSDVLGTRTELKNLNSFRFIKQAIEVESKRQVELLNSGQKVVQETRLFDPDQMITQTMRSKEDAFDYRYFPDPDLLPVHIDAAWIESVKQALPLPPDERQAQYQSDGLNDEEISRLMQAPDWADVFDQLALKVDHPKGKKLIINWLTGAISQFLNQKQMSLGDLPLSIDQIAALCLAQLDQTLTKAMAQKAFYYWLDHPSLTLDQIIDVLDLKPVNDESKIHEVIDQVLSANKEQVAQFQAGKTKLMGFFVGQVMQALKGQANPQMVNALLQQKLNDYK